MEEQVPRTQLKIKSKTWVTENKNLFDNHLGSFSLEDITISKSSIFILMINSIEVIDITTDEDIIERLTTINIKHFMFRIVQIQDDFWINKNPSSSITKIWLVVKEMTDQYYNILLGDIIKIGCIKLQVVTLCISIPQWTEPFESREDFLIAQPPYIVLKNISTDRIYYISLIDNKIGTIGRAIDNDVNIRDLSVSRYHASIKFQDNKFLLSDNNSRYGTLIHLKQSMKIENEPIVIQINRTQFKIYPISN